MKLANNQECMLTVYFLAAAASSSAALARFSRLPARRASDRAFRSLMYAFSSPSKSATFPDSTTTLLVIGKAFLLDAMLPSDAALASSALASPFFGVLLLRGKRISRALYAFSRSTLALSDSSLRFCRRGSTEIPTVGASFRGMPAS